MKYIKKGREPRTLIAIYKDVEKTYNDIKDDATKNIRIKKSDILQSLLKEQGYICCYCMQKIKIDGLTSASTLYPTIEHYIPQNPFEFDKILLKSTDEKNNIVNNIKRELLLLNIPSLPKLNKLSNDNVLLVLKDFFIKEGKNYNNMLATCHGNDKKDPQNKHCDSSKGNKFLKYLDPLDSSCERVLGYADDGSIVCMDSSHKSEIEDDITLLNLNFQRLKESRESVINGLKSYLKIERNKLKSKFDKENFKQKVLEKCRKRNGEYEKFVQVKIYWVNNKI